MAGPGGDPIMTTRVDITGNVAPLQQAVTQAKAEVKKLEVDTAMSGRAGAGGGGVGTGSVGAAAKGVDQELRTSAGRIFGIAGAATAAGAAIDRLIGSFNGFRNAGRDVVNQADSIGKALGSGSEISQGLTEAEKKAMAIAAATKEVRRDIESLGELNGVVDGVNKIALGAATTEAATTGLVSKLVAAVSPAALLYQWYKKGTEETVKQAELALKKAQDEAKAREEAAEKNRQELLLVESRKRVIELQNAELTGINKLNAEYRKSINEINERRKGASAELLASLDDEAKAEKSNYDKRVQRLVDEMREKRDAREKAAREDDKRANDAAERQAKALADAYAGAFDRIRADSANAFPAERLIGSIETMIERLEALADQRSRLRG
jgi:hypothetical protein